jgi:hypothetical protein
VRTTLAFKVLTGRVPLQSEKRWHNRNAETPVLIDIYDWTNDRRIFSVLVWPCLESDPETAALDHFERVAEVREVIARGATEMALTTRLDTDWDLSWDHSRKCWVASDGFAYDGWRTTDGRQPSGQLPVPDRGHTGRLSLSLAAPPEKTEEGS